MNTPPTGSANRIRPALGSPRGSFIGTVLANRTLCTDHYRLTLSVPNFPPSTPGQFVQLDCRDQQNQDAPPHEFEWPRPSTQHPSPNTSHPTPLFDPDFLAPVAYLRRPFSIADHRPQSDGTSEIDIIHRVVGRGTGHLACLQPGHTLSLLGPLGIGFTVPPETQTACLVGGGVGIPPMLYLAKTLAQHNCRRVAFLGAQRRDLLAVSLTAPPDPAGQPQMNVAELAPFHCSAIITTDDGSLGLKGYVTTALRQFLAGQPDNQHTVVYCCGPTPMMKATAKVAAEFTPPPPCQVSLEQPMACGMGTCQSCIIKYRPHTAPPPDSPDTDWKYKLTCTEGPVFDTRDIVW